MSRENKVYEATCLECGMSLLDAGEYHPYSFCVWKKAGQDPWETLETITKNLGLGPVPAHVLVRELPRIGANT